MSRKWRYLFFYFVRGVLTAVKPSEFASFDFACLSLHIFSLPAARPVSMEQWRKIAWQFSVPDCRNPKRNGKKGRASWLLGHNLFTLYFNCRFFFFCKLTFYVQSERYLNKDVYHVEMSVSTAMKIPWILINSTSNINFKKRPENKLVTTVELEYPVFKWQQ